MRRRLWTLTGALLAAVLLLTATPTRADETSPSVITLPNGFAPEGIVAGRGRTAYVGSLANGAIYAVNVRTGSGAELVPGQTGRVAVGLEFDRRTGYIYVAGGPTGAAIVYDSKTGDEVAAFSLFGPGGGFVNDAVVTKEAVYFTNSAQPVLYRVPLTRRGQPGAQAEVTTITLSGDWQQVAGFNANGIEASNKGDTLIVVNSTVGKLYAVDPATGIADEIELGGASVTSGDGLLREGNTLYVVRNQLNEIAAFKLAKDLGSAELVQTITSPNFAVPTTVASFGKALYAVNARFGLPPGPFTIVRVEP